MNSTAVATLHCGGQVSMKDCKWVKGPDVGWYILYNGDEVIAVVCRESYSPPWCVYTKINMPPGFSRHRTLAEAKAAALEAYRLYNIKRRQSHS